MDRLFGDGFDRPKVTFTDKMTEYDIKAKLKDYKRLNTIEELEEVALGVHLRYFDYVDNEYKFRMGGVLLNKTNLPNYIVLGNGSKTWCAQAKRCVFFKKMNNKEIEGEYDEVIEQQTKEITKLKDNIKKKVVKYKDGTINGDLTKYVDLIAGDYIICAHKRRKKIYDVMLIYDVKKVKKRIIELNTVDANFNKYKFNIDDYYFYVTQPKDEDHIVKTVSQMKKFFN